MPKARAAEERTKQTEATEEADRLERERKTGLDTRLQTAADTVRTLEIELATDRASYNSGLARLAVGLAIPAFRLSMRKLWRSSPPNGTGYRRPAWRPGLNCCGRMTRSGPNGRSNWATCGPRSIAFRPMLRFRRRRPSACQGEAKTAVDAANGARDTAVRTRDGLKTRAEQYEKLTAQAADR